MRASFLMSMCSRSPGVGSSWRNEGCGRLQGPRAPHAGRSKYPAPRGPQQAHRLGGGAPEQAPQARVGAPLLEDSPVGITALSTAELHAVPRGLPAPRRAVAPRATSAPSPCARSGQGLRRLPAAPALGPPHLDD